MAPFSTLEVTLSLKGKDHTFSVSCYTDPGFLLQFANQEYGAGNYTFMFVKGAKTPFVQVTEVEKIVLDALKNNNSEVITNRFHDSAKLDNNGVLAELILQVNKQRCTKEVQTSRKVAAPASTGNSDDDKDGLFNANQGHKGTSKGQLMKVTQSALRKAFRVIGARSSQEPHALLGLGGDAKKERAEGKGHKGITQQPEVLVKTLTEAFAEAGGEDASDCRRQLTKLASEDYSQAMRKDTSGDKKAKNKKLHATWMADYAGLAEGVLPKEAEDFISGAAANLTHEAERKKKFEQKLKEKQDAHKLSALEDEDELRGEDEDLGKEHDEEEGHNKGCGLEEGGQDTAEDLPPVQEQVTNLHPQGTGEADRSMAAGQLRQARQPRQTSPCKQPEQIVQELANGDACNEESPGPENHQSHANAPAAAVAPAPSDGDIAALAAALAAAKAAKARERAAQRVKRQQNAAKSSGKTLLKSMDGAEGAEVCEEGGPAKRQRITRNRDSAALGK